MTGQISGTLTPIVFSGTLLFELTVTDGSQNPLANVPVYVLTEGEEYTGLTGTTNGEGKVHFPLTGGSYKFRVDYLGSQLWTEVITYPATLSLTFPIPLQEVVVTVQKNYLGTNTPLNGVNVYLFTSGGSYMGKAQQTNSTGQTTFNLPAKDYKFRADYLSQQYWSAVINQQDTMVTINHGLAMVNVNDGGTPLGGVNVYVFNSTGSYLSINGQTNPNGDVSFEVPVGGYKFRADYSGTQYWSQIESITADQTTNINIDIQTAPHSFLERHYRDRNVMVASLSLHGVLSNTLLTQIPGDEVYYFHNDHLGTPQSMTDSIGTLVWKADYLPFGETTVDEDPDGDEIPVTNNLRFPGQYYDAETGLHYNWHRDYYPGVGRYIEADPMGIRSGTNHLYVYASNNPVKYQDNSGLEVRLCARPLGRRTTNPHYIIPHCYICVNSSSYSWHPRGRLGEGITQNDEICSDSFCDKMKCCPQKEAEFEQCVSQAAQGDIGQEGVWWVPTIHDCCTWSNGIVGKCWHKHCKCCK